MARARAHMRSDRQAGFTLVEIMVAITLLLVGVLGVVTLVSAATRSSTATNGRQNATNLLRRVIETARAVPYRTLKSSGLQTVIQNQSPDLASTSGGSWTVQRGGFTYTIAPSLCLVDDGADGYGAHGATDPAWCSDSSQTGTADSQPNDYKRLSVTITWSEQGRTKTMTQAGVVPSVGQGDLPATTSVAPTIVTPVTSQGTTTIPFNAAAINNPASLTWLADGQRIGGCPPTTSACGGSGSAWNFTWGIGAPTLDTTTGSPNNGMCIAGSYVYDGWYTVSPRAYDAAGLTGDAASTRIKINRCAPIPPPNFNATGRDKFSTGGIDIEWNDNPEDDVVGYRVYAGTSAATATQVCPASGSGFVPASQNGQSGWACYDPSPPPPPNGNQTSNYYYYAYAYDYTESGALRRGAYASINVNTGNARPFTPSSPAATLNADGSVTLRWTVPNPQDPDTGETIQSFRVYRRAATAQGNPSYSDRQPDGYDSIDAMCTSAASGATCSYTDTSTGGVQHLYNVTSVDPHLRESLPTSNSAMVR